MQSIRDLQEKYESLDRRLSIQGEEAIDASCLLTFEYQYPEREAEIVVDTDEFTAVCPWTGLPDLGQLTIRYVPDRLCLELKSLKYYLLSYREVGIVQEHAANSILNDLSTACRPLRMTLTLDYKIRGGIHSTVTVNYVNPPPRNKGRVMKFSPFFVVVAALFITALITSNITAVKLVSVAGQIVPAGLLIFPVSYIMGDVLTEVYGYRYARLVIWLGFGCNLLAVAAIWGGQVLPPAPDWEAQDAYARILGYTPRLLGASFAAYLVGEFVNSFILAKMKIATRGRWLWSRTIGSTVVGQALDSLIFISLAFGGTVPLGILIRIVVTQWLAKVIYETAATPLTYMVVGWLKKREQVDHYDYETSFSPMALFR